MDLKTYVRDVPDFPKPGIIFKDITPLLKAPEALSETCEQLAAPYKNDGITAVMPSFLYGAASCSHVSLSASGALSSGVMSLKMMPGFGKSGTSRTYVFRSIRTSRRSHRDGRCTPSSPDRSSSLRRSAGLL